jgi:hypothetical protein
MRKKNGVMTGFRLAFLRAGLATTGVLAAEAALAQDTPDVDLERPLEIRTRAPLCLTIRHLDDALMLAMQGQYQMAAEDEGCIRLLRPTRVFVMEKRDEPPFMRLRVRWRQSDGSQMDAWTNSYFLQNVREQPPPTPQRRQRGPNSEVPDNAFQW